MTVRLTRFLLSAFVFFDLSPFDRCVGSTALEYLCAAGVQENEGQAPQQYLFLSRHNGVEAMFLPNGVDPSLPETTGSYQRLQLRLVGSSDSARITSLDRTEGQSNYLLGTDPSRWVRRVPNYSRIKYEAIYPGIDLVFYGNANKLEHDFQIAAGANISRIALQFEGAKEPTSLTPAICKFILKKAFLSWISP